MKKLILSIILFWTMFSYGQDEYRPLSSTEVLHKGKYIIGAIHYANRVCIMFRDVDSDKIEVFYISRDNYNNLYSLMLCSGGTEGEIYQLPTTKSGILSVEYKRGMDTVYPVLSWERLGTVHNITVITHKQIKKLLGS